MLDNFNRSNVDILLSLGYEVTLAANFHSKEEVSPQEKIDAFAREMRAKGVHIVHIDFSRNMKNAGMQIRSVLQVRKLLKRQFDLVHCHSPICAAIVRTEAAQYRRKNQMKVFYTAHGFHFFDGSPVRNWLFYYPAERALSRLTDVLITINHEDHKRAKKHFHAGKTVYIPGIGVDTGKFTSCSVTREEKRRELKIPDDAFVLLSIGELHERKNQKAVIEALHRLQKPGIVYLIIGQGKLEDEYRRMIKAYGLEGNIRMPGFRRDIAQLCRAADCFIHPSVREGFGIAPMEAMAAGLPLISSNVNGMRDYTENGKTGICIDPGSVHEIAGAIQRMMEDESFRLKCGQYNAKKAKQYDMRKTEAIMQKIYKEAYQ